jgi:ubiquinol-cytochrome c reductase cytochrome b subunit
LGNNVADKISAPDLKDFASREWISGLLDPEKIVSPHYFGNTKFKDGKMVKFVKKEAPKYTAEDKQKLLKVIAALSAEAGLRYQADLDKKDAGWIKEGIELARSDMKCTDCHQFKNKDEEATAPDLTGYGSRAWLIEFISSPEHARFYGKNNDRMPSFAEQMDPKQIELVADWLRHDWFHTAEGR